MIPRTIQCESYAYEKHAKRKFSHCKKGFVLLTIVFLTRIATVDMVLWDDTRIVPCDDSQLWAIQCTWSSCRNN